MSQVSVERALEIASQHYTAGRWRDAEAVYRQVLAHVPDHVTALHSLGILLGQQRRYAEAEPPLRRVIQLRPSAPEPLSDLANVLRDTGRFAEAAATLQRAAAINPSLPIVHCNLGNVLRDLGQHDEAIASFRRAIALKPDYAEAFSNLGTALCDLNRLPEAAEAIGRAIFLNPAFAAAHNNLGVVLQKLNRSEQAAASFRRAIELWPEYAEAYSNLGQSLELSDRPDEAIAFYRQALTLSPNLASAHCNLGNALLDKRQTRQAIAEYRRAIELQPDFPEAHNNLGNALCDDGKIPQAIESYHHALRLKPDYVAAISNIACTLIDQGKLDEPERLLRKAIRIQPDFADAHWNLGILLLLRGDFERGLPEYEWRWKVRNVMRGSTHFPQPAWDGGALDGKVILLHAEQGLGDAIQFARYVPLVAARGGKIILRCPTALTRLFAELAEIVDPKHPPPPFDEHCPLLSLPLALGTRVETIPASIPYLRADAESANRWKKKLAQTKSGRRIGLAWAGAGIHKNDRYRSTTLSSFQSLSKVKDATFFSLQKGDAAAEIPPPGLDLLDFTAELMDFADTAALIENLDLVITVDTSVAHLAGAMGKPVWVILPSNPDWRWMLDRTDTPWYPTMRLYRQRKWNDWEYVIEEVVADLMEGKISNG